MKSIYTSFEDTEFKRLERMKKKTGKSWKDYIIHCAELADRCEDDGR